MRSLTIAAVAVGVGTLVVLTAPRATLAGSEPSTGSSAPSVGQGAPSTPEEHFAFLTSGDRGRALSTDEIASAESAFRNAIDKEPARGRWVAGLGLVARARGEKEKAVELGEKAVKLSPDDADVQLWYGTFIFENIDNVGMFSKMGYASDGRKAFEKAVELAPSNFKARYALAQYYIGAPGIAGGSMKKAREQGEAMIALGGRGAYMGHLLLGQIAGADERWDDACAEYGLAADLAPLPRDVASMMATRVSILVGKKNDAAAALKIVDEMESRCDAGDTAPDYCRGLAHQKLGEYAKAADHYRKVISAKPEAVNSRFFLAQCLAASGDDAGAIREYQQFVERNPKDQRVDEAKKQIKQLTKRLAK